MRRMLVAVLALAAVTTAHAEEARRSDGQRTYAVYCAGCHGERGDGKGPAADMLLTKPRDFTTGVFKFRSTPAGSLPTDADIFRTITRGVHRTSMPGWWLIPEQERWALVETVKAFYPAWAATDVGPAILVPAPPPDLESPANVARGRTVYETLECGTCHGDRGRGDGPSASQLEPDTWGNPQKPFDFTKGALKSGGAPTDVYRTFMTGLNGTAMPSYYDIFAEPDGEFIQDGDAWNLVAYVLSLRAPTKGAPRP